MFAVSRTYYGVTYPLPAIYINDATATHTESNLSIVATRSAELLAIFTGSVTATFTDSDTLDEFPFPLSGSDFLVSRDGSIAFDVLDTLTDGLYKYVIGSHEYIPGIYGYGPFGILQGGNLTDMKALLPLFLQVQQLTLIPSTSPAARVQQPYTVGTVIRL